MLLGTSAVALVAASLTSSYAMEPPVNSYDVIESDSMGPGPPFPTEPNSQNPDCPFAKLFSKAMEYLYIEEKPVSDVTLSKNLQKFDGYLKEKGMKISYNHENSKKIGISAKETAPESFKRGLESKWGDGPLI